MWGGRRSEEERWVFGDGCGMGGCGGVEKGGEGELDGLRLDLV